MQHFCIADLTTPLRRTLSLPLLIFTGLGVTIGAGIFALIGEILGVAGDLAPLAFLTAGLIASFTGVSYMALVAQYPQAGGEAVYVRRGIGSAAGRFAGLGVVATGVVSSAVVALAFAGYVSTLVDVPERLAAATLVVALAGVAWLGVRESVALAAVVTTLELGTLLVVVAFGLPDVDVSRLGSSFNIFSAGAVAPTLTAAGIAFFAFIGFEDIANMAEETIDPRRTAPRAIAWTLVVTIVVYVLLAVIAMSLPERSDIVESSAPMASVFEQASGYDPAPIATIASFAMVNGILVQIVMASRVLYGMANDGQVHGSFATVSRRRKTPTVATGFVAVAIIVLATTFPLSQLARVTSVITLAVFSLVNIALVRLARQQPQGPLRRFLPNAVAGAATSIGLGIWQLVDLVR